MVPTTDNKERRIEEFYDGLSGDFDRMTAFETRLVSERPFYQHIVNHYGITSALDAGAGTGFHSILLSQLGVKVTAVDVSSSMLDILRRHATEKHVSVEILQSAFRDMPPSLPHPFDAVFCMGNTLAHVLEEQELFDALSGFRRLLKTGGTLILQILNYERILRDRQRVQNVRESEGVTYIRAYDFDGDRLVFNVRKVVHHEGTSEEQHRSVPMRPWRSDDLIRLLALAGFTRPESFGSIALDGFKSETSKDLVILTRNRS